MTPISKNTFVTKTLAPKFCEEWSDREVHSSHGDCFRCNFCVYVSGQLSDDIRASFDDKTYQYKTFTTKKGTTIEGYLVILYEGKRYSLFRQDKKKLSEGRKAKTPLEADIQPRFSDTYTYFMSNDNSEINEISFKLKNIIPLVAKNDNPKFQKIKGGFKKIKTEEKLIELIKTLEK